MVIIIELRGSQTVVGLYQECWSGSDRSPGPTSSPSPPILTSSSLSLLGPPLPTSHHGCQCRRNHKGRGVRSYVQCGCNVLAKF